MEYGYTAFKKQLKGEEPEPPALKLWEIDDGERHYICAPSPAKAIEILRETFEMDADDLDGAEAVEYSESLLVNMDDCVNKRDFKLGEAAFEVLVRISPSQFYRLPVGLVSSTVY